VITAHRKRTGELGDTFRRVLELEQKLFDLRSKSWALQVVGAATREADLDQVHGIIDTTITEVDTLRESLRSGELATIPPTAEAAESLT
jgi:hypothetical protein